MLSITTFFVHEIYDEHKELIKDEHLDQEQHVRYDQYWVEQHQFNSTIQGTVDGLRDISKWQRDQFNLKEANRP